MIKKEWRLKLSSMCVFHVGFHEEKYEYGFAVIFFSDGGGAGLISYCGGFGSRNRKI
jgi:hypothetical protein